LIDADMEVLQIRGDTGLYLSLAPGKPSLSLLKMLREGLLVGVRGAIIRAKREDAPVREEGLRVKSNGGYREVHLQGLLDKTASTQNFLVLFEEPGSYASSPVANPAAQVEKQPAASSAKAEGAELAEGATTRLQQELAATREYLQSMIEQQEAANEELQ